MERRAFLQFGAASLAAVGGPLLFVTDLCQAQTSGGLQNIRGDRLRFGSGLYVFRSAQDPVWLISEAKALGLNEIRVEFSRDRVEAASNDQIYNPAQYLEPRPDVVDLLRQSGLNVILTLDGYRKDANHQIVDWPRNADGTVNGGAAALGMANFTRWTVAQMGDFVYAYELWNEAFNTNFDQQFSGIGFGPGGSRENADNYASMMLPSLRIIRQYQPGALVLIEGNYWNLERSVRHSDFYQHLLQQADYVVLHPYGYKLSTYAPPQAPATKGGVIYEDMKLYPRINPRIGFWYTEYNVSPANIGRTDGIMPDDIQSKVVLRATLLHLLQGVCHLDIFCMFYPTIPGFTLTNADKTRRPAWYALQRLIASIGPTQISIADSLSRTSVLPDGVRDVAIANSRGFAYLIWQETTQDQFGNTIPTVPATVQLKVTGRRLSILNVIDPTTGNTVDNVTVGATADNGLSIKLSVADYPIIFMLGVA